MTFRNMVYSVIPIAVLALLWWSITYNPEAKPRAVETGPSTAYAVDQADWPVWVPEPGEGWTPTVVYYDVVEDIPTWHVSYVTPDGEYAAIHQASDVTDAWLEQVLAGGEETGSATLPGPTGDQTWQVFEGPRPSNAENAWVLDPEHTDGSTVVVHGTIDEDGAAELLRTVDARD